MMPAGIQQSGVDASVVPQLTSQMSQLQLNQPSVYIRHISLIFQ